MLLIFSAKATYPYLCNSMKKNMGKVTIFSSLRAKRAGPKGLHAESARAVTVRQCRIVGGVSLFAASDGSPHENSHNSGTKSRKMLPKAPKRPEGYKRSIDENRGPISKNGFSGQKPKILAQKKGSTS